MVGRIKARLYPAKTDQPEAGLTFETPTPYHAMTEYWHLNASDSAMEAAWDAIETNPLAIALDDSFAKRVELEPSTPFPWDTERSIYYVKGIHDLHCLVRRLKLPSSLPG